MKILAIDPATQCGWAQTDTDWFSAAGTKPRLFSGVWNLALRKDESTGMKLVRFRAKLDEMFLACGGFDLVVFEAARHAMPKMQGALVHQAKIQGVLEEWCSDKALGGAKLEYRGYSPSEIKKFATGKGNAKKQDMLAVVATRWNFVTQDDNEADAIALLMLAVNDFAPAPVPVEVPSCA